jgi:hypothetical protein
LKAQPDYSSISVGREGVVAIERIETEQNSYQRVMILTSFLRRVCPHKPSPQAVSF